MSKNGQSLIEAIQHIKTNYSHALEFGVAKGRSINVIRNHVPKHYEVFGFDTFTGLPEDWISKEGKVVGNKGVFSTNGKLPDVKNVNYYVGLFKDTLPQYLKIAQNIALLHVDCDLYASAKEVLYALNSFIKKGTIIVFDEWVYYRNSFYDDHEQKAFLEWVEDKQRTYKFIETSESHLPECEQKVIEVTNEPV